MSKLDILREIWDGDLLFCKILDGENAFLILDGWL